MYKVNKYILITLIIILILISAVAFILRADFSESKSVKKLLYIKSSSVRSVAYAGGAAWARAITSNTDYIAVNSASPATMKEKIDMLMSGEIDAAFLTGPGSYLAYNGHPDYWNKPQDIRALFGLWPAVYNSVAYADSKINSLNDLTGKKIAISADRSPDGDLISYLLELNGITGKNTTIYRVRESIGEKMFSRKEVDFIWYYMGYGHSFLDNFNPATYENADEIKLIPVGEKNNLREFLSIFPVFYTDTFNYNDSLFVSRQLFTSNFVACSLEMPYELAYDLTRLWWENLDLIRQFVPEGIEIDSKINIQKGVPVPLHPGAAAYFADADLIP